LEHNQQEIQCCCSRICRAAPVFNAHGDNDDMVIVLSFSLRDLPYNRRGYPISLYP
jgi:hypothetical protein